MNRRPIDRLSRRAFLGGFGAMGAVGLLGGLAAAVAAEPPLETGTIKLRQPVPVGGAYCGSQDFLAEELLKAEGFTDVRWVNVAGFQGTRNALASGEIDFNIQFAGSYIVAVDAGDPIVLLTGIHVGCYELFAAEPVRTIRDLKGKSVAVTELGSGRHLFFASALRYVGLDPGKDVTLITQPTQESMQLFTDGKIDAYMGFPPEPQALRAKKIGHVVLNSTADRPWSQYFCCMLAGNKEFVQKHPGATKRALRAILKATDMCALEPSRVAQVLVSRGITTSYDHTLQTLKELPYDTWRTFSPEDTVRFYALRLHEAGLIKTSPQKLIAQGTDWRFLNELKKELKG
jgi:NitT/TauT family transport system substrate-binding protein